MAVLVNEEPAPFFLKVLLTICNMQVIPNIQFSMIIIMQ